MRTFIDLFCGVGGFRLGLEQAGFECVFSSEINIECCKTYTANFGDIPSGDIRQIDTDAIPDHDILCAGFPCQPFSISGRLLGFEDTRGTLFFEICRVIKAKQPSVVFLENVKHLVHHDKGKTLSVILSTLADLGYTVSWRVLNASKFGVPQNRERIILIGTRNGVIFDFDSLEQKPVYDMHKFLDNYALFKDTQFLDSSTYTLLDTIKTQESGMKFCGYLNKTQRKRGVNAELLYQSRVHRQPNRIYSADGVHPTLSSQETSGRYYIKLPMLQKVRKLTLDECWRFMGFPSSFKRVSSVSEQYKQLGNSVCVPMITEIAKGIKNQILT